MRTNNRALPSSPAPPAHWEPRHAREGLTQPGTPAGDALCQGARQSPRNHAEVLTSLFHQAAKPRSRNCGSAAMGRSPQTALRLKWATLGGQAAGALSSIQIKAPAGVLQMHQQRFVTQNLLVSSAVPGSPGCAGTAAAPGQPGESSRTSRCRDSAKEVRAALLPAWRGRASALPLTRRFLEGDRLLTQLSPSRRVPGLVTGSVLPPAPATLAHCSGPLGPVLTRGRTSSARRG